MEFPSDEVIGDLLYKIQLELDGEKPQAKEKVISGQSPVDFAARKLEPILDEFKKSTRRLATLEQKQKFTECWAKTWDTVEKGVCAFGCLNFSFFLENCSLGSSRRSGDQFLIF